MKRLYSLQPTQQPDAEVPQWRQAQIERQLQQMPLTMLANILQACVVTMKEVINSHYAVMDNEDLHDWDVMLDKFESVRGELLRRGGIEATEKRSTHMKQRVQRNPHDR